MILYQKDTPYDKKNTGANAVKKYNPKLDAANNRN
jgi:hypothetical protein